MSWFDLVKLHPDEESDFRRFGQPEWDKGMEEISDNKIVMGLTEVFTKRPDLRVKYKEAKPEIQNVVKLIAKLRKNIIDSDRNRENFKWSEKNTDVTGDRKPIERVDVMDDSVDDDDLIDAIEAALEDNPDYDFRFKDWEGLL